MKSQICILLLISFFLSIEKIKAQGGRSAGLAGSNVTLEDQSSAFNNTAGTGSQKRTSAIVAVDNRYGIDAFNTISAALVVPCKIGVGSIDVSRFGNNLYNESHIGLGFSHQIQSVSLGLKTSYQQYHIDEYGTRGLFIFEFGGLAKIIPKVSFGAHIYNFTKAEISKETGEKLPVTMKIGLGYQPGEKLLLLTEVEKTENKNPRAKAGMEYKIIKTVALRTGFSTNPISSAFGFGLFLKQLKVDYALNSHQKLGFQNTFSVTYMLGKK